MMFSSKKSSGKKSAASSRSKSATNKDRKYYNADQSWEKSYAKATGRKKKKYSK
jgi:hypothetical protein